MNEDQSREDLGIYLKDHFAGGVGAVELLEHLVKEHADDPLGAFFSELRAEIQADHEQLHNLMTALGYEESSLRNAGAWMAEKFSHAKIGFAAGKESKLGLLQALEALLLGINGKRLLWRSLAVTKHSSPILQKTDLARLEARAVDQADRADTQRLKTARAAFRAV